MTMDRFVLAFAGMMVLASLALTLWVPPNVGWLTDFIGFNLVQAAFTGLCPAALLMRRPGLRRGPAF